jgi:DNA invertase Pin-like site-specific DNA recombinase
MSSATFLIVSLILSCGLVCCVRAQMRVALYARVSRHDKDQNPENQLLRLREFVSQQDWQIYKIYIDYASGAKTSRPELDQMLRDAKARRFDAIVVQRVDRLARSTQHLLDILQNMRERGIEVICTDQDVDTTTSQGKFIYTILGAVSEIELNLIRERTMDGLARARAEGKRLGRPPSPVITERIIELKREGYSLREIGGTVGLSHQAVKQRLRRYRVQKRVEKTRGGQAGR